MHHSCCRESIQTVKAHAKTQCNIIDITFACCPKLYLQFLSFPIVLILILVSCLVESVDYVLSSQVLQSVAIFRLLNQAMFWYVLQTIDWML